MERLPRIVSARLGIKPADAHPDPDLLTGFAEQSLKHEERAAVLSHLAACADCREVLALSVPPAEVAQVTSAPVDSGWLRWPVLRWGTLAACAIVVAAAVGLRYHATTSTAVQMAKAPAPRALKLDSIPARSTVAAVPAAEPMKQAQARGDFVGQATDQKKSTEKEAKQAQAQVALDSGNLAKVIPQAAAPPPAATNELQENAKAVELSPENGPSSEPESAAAESEMAMGKAKQAPKDELRRDAAVAQGSTVAFAPQPMAPAAKSLNALATVAPRWTLSSDGVLQRSLDQGRSWTAVSVPTNATLRAVAASGSDIWVGGTAGTVFHSPDSGGHWLQVRPVARGLSLAADVTGVEFSDAQHGKLTTSDRRVWSTQDGGKSWAVQ